jgi:hypothetical protein
MDVEDWLTFLLIKSAAGSGKAMKTEKKIIFDNSN